jgi:hypothetical protein
VVRDRQRHGRVLLDQQHARALLVDLHDEVANLLHDQRCEPQRRLVEEQQPWRCHQPPRHRAHLLFAAGEVTGRLFPALREHRKEAEDLVVRLLDAGAVAPRERAGAQVLVDRELGEDAPAFHHLGRALADDLGRVEAVDALAVELDRPARDRAAMETQKAGDRAQQRCLAGAVGAEEGDDLARRHLEADTPQHLDRGAVHDLEVPHGKNPAAITPHGHWPPWVAVASSGSCGDGRQSHRPRAGH